MKERNIVEYTMVSFTNSNELNMQIKKLVEENYQPYGMPFSGIHVNFDQANGNVHSVPFINQAMVKYEETDILKTKNFEDYLKKSLTYKEIKDIEKEAKEEFKLMRKSCMLCGHEKKEKQRERR
jgi:hypothetical protein